MSETKAAERDEFFDSLLGDFLDESAQLLDRLNEDLLQLDEWVRSLDEDHRERCDDDLMNNMFRSAHSLKGLSAMLGLGDINHLTHKVENVFDAARKDELFIDADTVELMFQATDRLVGLVDALKETDADPIECESVIAAIGDLLRSAGAERKQTSQADAERALEFDATDAESPAEEETNQQSDRGEADLPRAEPAETPEPLNESSDVVPASETPAEDTAPPNVDYFEGLEDETDVPSKYLSIFIDETELSLDSLTEALLALEGKGGSDTVDVLLVTSHRIKGSAASVGLNRPAKLAHLMEDLLQNLADTGRPLSAEMTDALLKCTDALRYYLEQLRRGSATTDNFNEMAHELLDAETWPKPDDAQPQQPDGPQNGGPEQTTEKAKRACEVSDELRQQADVISPDRDATFLGAAAFEPNLPLVGLKARLLYEKLSNLGEVCLFTPPAATLDSVEQLDGVSFALVTSRSQDAVQAALRVAGVTGTVVEPLVKKEAATASDASETVANSAAGESTPNQTPAARTEPAQAKSRTADVGTRPTETLRVDIERLDQLMNLAGQLVINKARFSQIGDRLKGVLSGKQSSHVLGSVFGTLERMSSGKTQHGDESSLRGELEYVRGQARRVQNDLDAVRRDVEMLGGVRSSVNELIETIHQLDRVTDGIQQSVMDTRMLPIGPLFARFKRVIRDITRGNGKSINLIVKGEKTELDKRMIDELGDPLIHMVRNSADHGIEPPEVRRAAGKPEQGTITLDAFHRGNSIFIQVTDDGKGLDPERIRRKAVERGLHTQAELDRMTPHQIYQLIWEPGLSTAEKVTEVSGRGMGMDIVKSKIEDLSGLVDLDSEPGAGTTLTIKLPLTLAILPSLMVDIAGDVFALPMESVVEIVSPQQCDLATVHGQQTARVRGRIISMVRLDDVFSWNRTSSHTGHDGSSDETENTLVILGEDGNEIGLAVDRVLGEEDIVIKSMAENYRNVAGIAGASILGDGRVSLILDLAALIEMASTQESAGAIA